MRLVVAPGTRKRGAGGIVRKGGTPPTLPAVARVAEPSLVPHHRRAGVAHTSAHRAHDLASHHRREQIADPLRERPREGAGEEVDRRCKRGGEHRATGVTAQARSTRPARRRAHPAVAARSPGCALDAPCAARPELTLDRQISTPREQGLDALRGAPSSPRVFTWLCASTRLDALRGPLAAPCAALSQRPAQPSRSALRSPLAAPMKPRRFHGLPAKNPWQGHAHQTAHEAAHQTAHQTAHERMGGAAPSRFTAPPENRGARVLISGPV